MAFHFDIDTYAACGSSEPRPPDAMNEAFFTAGGRGSDEPQGGHARTECVGVKVKRDNGLKLFFHDEVGGVRIPLPMFLECPWEASNTQKDEAHFTRAVIRYLNKPPHRHFRCAPIGATRALLCNSRSDSSFDDTAAGATHNDVG